MNINEKDIDEIFDENSPDLVVEYHYRIIRLAYDISDKRIFPVVKSVNCLGNLDKKETAIVGLYYRMHLLVRALTKLEMDTSLFQTTAGIARSLFEILIEMRLLYEDEAGDCVRMLYDFITLDKYEGAMQILIGYVIGHDGLHKYLDSRIRYIVEKRNEINLIESNSNIKYYDKHRKLKHTHWTCKGIKRRISDIKNEADREYMKLMYAKYYKLFSWYVHDGIIGVLGISNTSYKGVFVLALELATRSFLDGLSICAKIMSVDKACELLACEIINLRDKKGEVLQKAIMDMIESKVSEHRDKQLRE